jgi:hypothetical protein
MRMTSQDYAELAEHSYDRAGNMHDLKDQQIILEGVTYKVLEHVDNSRNGYQGTIYQRMDSGEIIVAHRGTEFERERWKDLVLTDGAMVIGRTNPQAADAIALTQRALEIAEKEGQLAGHKPEVTVTGHSLGGTLAQISAHYYDLRGETFNAYGAVSLHHQVPKGGDRVINHVTAADLVSSGSQHYGQVRVYAMPQEIEMLQGRGYANNDSRVFDPRNKLRAAIDGLDSHDMHYFRNVDGNGRADRSVLSDPRMRELAREYAPMIVKYRRDVEDMRDALSASLRGPGGALLDGINRLRGPLEPGEPAAREERERAAQEARQSRASPAGQSSSRSPLGELGDEMDRRLYRTLYGEDPVEIPLRRQVPVTEEASRAHLGPLQSQAAEAAKSDYVDQLLQAARDNDPDAIRAATQGLQQSAFGQAWQQRVDSLARASELVQTEQQQAQQPALGR